MSKTKRRGHRGGRPSNQALLAAQRGEIQRLRQLISRRNHNDQTWQLIDRLLATTAELQELATPLKAATYDGIGHSADRPIFPGVHLAADGADIDHPDGDGETNRGDLNLYHGGQYAEHLAGWLNRQIGWAITTVDRRLRGREEDPKPRPPARETANFTKGQNPQSPSDRNGP